MAFNPATDPSSKVAERFFIEGSLTRPGTNTEYDFIDSAAVKVYSVDTASLGDYTRSGFNRYGSPTEVGTTSQTLTLARDRSFARTIDRRNNAEQKGVTEAAKFLAREMREVVIPEVDTYILAAMNTAADANGKDDVTTDAAVSASNAYSNFLLLQSSLNDDLVPTTDRVFFLNSTYANYLKQSAAVIDSSQAYADRKSGDYGMLDGVRLIVVPSSYMPTNTAGILVHPSATVAPFALNNQKTHEDPPGINGWLVEGRFVYDAFVLDAKVDAIAVHRVA